MKETAKKTKGRYDYLVSLADKLNKHPQISKAKVHCILVTPISPAVPHPREPKRKYIHRAFIVYGTSTRSAVLKHIDSCVWEA